MENGTGRVRLHDEVTLPMAALGLPSTVLGVRGWRRDP